MVVNSPPRALRFVFIAFAGVSLLTALWSGLARMGWDLPVPNIDFVSLHGPLMAIGFLATLIGLERAAAVNQWWVYGIPLFNLITIVALVFDAPLPVITMPAILAAVLQTAVLAALYRRQPNTSLS